MDLMAVIMSIFIIIMIAILALPAVYGDRTGEDLLHKANSMLKEMKDTKYSHETYIDESKGIYEFDCSGFVDYLIAEIEPKAEDAIPHSEKDRPLAKDFYKYFKDLSKKPNKIGWSRVEHTADLKPGDIIAWLKVPSDKDSENTGHVMIVARKPSVNPDRKKEMLIHVIDSTSSPHSDDSRKDGATGLGKGIIGILVNDKDKPIGFFWKGRISEETRYTKISFGRLN